MFYEKDVVRDLGVIFYSSRVDDKSTQVKKVLTVGSSVHIAYYYISYLTLDVQDFIPLGCSSFRMVDPFLLSFVSTRYLLVRS